MVWYWTISITARLTSIFYKRSWILDFILGIITCITRMPQQPPRLTSFTQPRVICTRSSSKQQIEPWALSTKLQTREATTGQVFGASANLANDNYGGLWIIGMDVSLRTRYGNRVSFEEAAAGERGSVEGRGLSVRNTTPPGNKVGLSSCHLNHGGPFRHGHWSRLNHRF